MSSKSRIGCNSIVRETIIAKWPTTGTHKIAHPKAAVDLGLCADIWTYWSMTSRVVVLKLSYVHIA